MDRILRDTPARVRLTIRDASGTLWDPDDDAMEAVVTDSAGGAVGTYAATRESPGLFRIDVPASETEVLDVYSVAWTGTFDAEEQTFHSEYEVVGGFFFSVSEARSFDGGALTDESAYPLQSIVDAREQVESEIEDACGVAFVPRGARVALDGSGGAALFLPHIRIRDVVEATEDDTAVDLDDVTLRTDDGVLILSVGSWAIGDRNVSVLYEHGYTQPPARIKRAALILLRDRLVRSNVNDRALSYTDDSGTMQMSVAGVNGAFGIPEVDAAVAQYTEHIAVLG